MINCKTDEEIRNTEIIKNYFNRCTTITPNDKDNDWMIFRENGNDFERKL